MGIFYKLNEQKKRPGVYQQYMNRTTALSAAGLDGIAAVVLKANWGTFEHVLTFSNEQEASEYFGEAQMPAELTQLFLGSAAKALVVRVGKGGSKGTITLKDASENEAVDITLKYAGTRCFHISLQNVSGDDQKKELVLLEGTAVKEKFTLHMNGTADDLVEALKQSKYLDAVKKDGYVKQEVLAPVAMVEIKGSNPDITKEDYRDAFALLEPHRYNVITTDSNDYEVHKLLASFMKRAYQDGRMAFAVVGEPLSVPFDTRLAHASQYNSYLMVYSGSGIIDQEGNTIDGSLMACHIAGLIAGTPSSQSITRKVIAGAVELKERLTNAQYEACINHGMIVLSSSASGSIWVDSGITTLTSLQEEDDEGWKKIKRVKIRFEIMDRANDTVEPLIGSISNNADGIATIIQAVQGVLNSMVAEGKLMSGASVYADETKTPAGDSAWFVISADDIDAIEKAYFKMMFRFSAV